MRSRLVTTTAADAAIALALVAAVAAAAAGCHTISRVDETINGDTTLRRRDDEPPRAQAPAVAVGADGHLRFVEPLLCSHDVVVAQENYQVVEVEANIALVIVGIIAGSAGAISLVSGLSDDEPVDSPLTWAGGLGVAVGIPLIVGPFRNTRTDRIPTGDTELVRGKKDAACGDRPLPGRSATVEYAGLRFSGAVDDAGRFASSPFTVIDAYDLANTPPAPLTVDLVRADGEHVTVEDVLDPGELAAARDAYLTALGVDPAIEDLRKVPRLEATNLSVTRTRTDDGLAAVRIGLVLENSGPGDAWGVRGQLAADNPDIQGRYLYIGHVPAKSTIQPSVVIPLANSTVRFDQIGLTMMLLDAHATSPQTPIQFRGVVLNDGR